MAQNKQKLFLKEGTKTNNCLMPDHPSIFFRSSRILRGAAITSAVNHSENQIIIRSSHDCRQGIKMPRFGDDCDIMGKIQQATETISRTRPLPRK